MKQNQFMSTLQAGAVVFSICACLAVPEVVLAQTANDKVVEEIVVQGYRGSVRAALEAKRNAVGAVDSIMAEDIADFPDTNLAEALQRIPGIAITREAGEGREITVRGLDAQYTRVTINDVMGHSLAAGSGGARTNRTFDFNVFASELFNRVDVHKTTAAEMEEGSLGATVSLHTGRPFDYDPFAMALNLQTNYNDQSEKNSPRISGLISGSNADKTLGGLLSVSYAERFVNNTGADTGRWENDQFGSCSACADAAEEDQVSGAWHPRFPRYSDKTHDQERLGLTGSVQFAPSNTTLITADVLYSTIDSRRTEPFMEAISLARTGSTGIDETDVADFTIDNNNTIVAATMDGVDTRSENFVSNWDSEFVQYQIKLEQSIGDRLQVSALLARSESELNNSETTMIFEHYSDGDPRQYATYADTSDELTYNFDSMLNPGLSYSFDTTDPANWEVSEFRDRMHFGKTGSDVLHLDAAYDLNDSMTLKAGIAYKEYSFDQTLSQRDRAFSAADDSDGTDGSACGIDYTVGSAMGNVMTAGNVGFFLADEGLFNTFRNSGCWPSVERPQDFRDITEEDTGYYVQLDFTTELGSHTLRGNLGVRAVNTDLTSSAVTFVDNVETPVTVEHDYDDTLPALNLAYNLSDEIIVRASWAKVMSRPNLSTLSPFGSVTIFGVPAVSYGNPFIEPFRADNTDLSFEWYFADDSLVSLSYFKKAIESFPTTETVILPWPEVGLPDSLLGAQVDDLIDADFEVRRTINGGGADLDGWELQYQQLMTFLPAAWMQNIGIVANYTWVSSEEDDNGLPLTGQSDDSYNLTVYYEDDRFSTRLAYSYRGDFTTTNNDDFNAIRYREETANLDFSASYFINDNFKATFEVINITDEPQIDYMAPGIGRVISEQTTGRQWLLGVTYRH